MIIDNSGCAPEWESEISVDRSDENRVPAWYNILIF